MSRPSAEAAVDLAISRYREEVSGETLRLFRLNLQVTVRRASPLALALAREERLDVAESMGRLRPGPNWLASPALSGIPGADSGVAPRRGRSTPRPLRHGYASSLALADYERADGPLSLDVAQGVVQVVGRVGPCSIHTLGSNARLTLPTGVPETVLEAMRGREVDVLVDHPAFTGRGYVVRDVLPPVYGGAALVFGTGLVRYEMPWRDLLRDELAAARFDQRMRDPASRRDSRAGVGA